jgi:hypothetical protein
VASRTLIISALIISAFSGFASRGVAAEQGAAQDGSPSPDRHAARDAVELPVSGLRPIFRAGFEAPVAIIREPSGRQARLAGLDSYGMSWNNLDHVFELVAPGAFDNLVTVRFSQEHVHSGERSLYLRQNKEEAGAQARLQFFSDDKTFSSEIFTRRYYYIPSTNLGTLSREQQSTSIAGTREARGSTLPAGHPMADFSMPLYVVRRGDKLVFAQAIVDYSAGSAWSAWTRPPKGLVSYGNMVACPLDRWFRLDIYVLRHPTKGQIKVWVDGQPIINLNNVRTKNDTDVWFTKIADVDSEPAPFEAWVDDVEIWSR